MSDEKTDYSELLDRANELTAIKGIEFELKNSLDLKKQSLFIGGITYNLNITDSFPGGSYLFQITAKITNKFICGRRVYGFESCVLSAVEEIRVLGLK